MIDFSDLVSAIKPRNRTPQYKILSALYSLGADRQPVTTSEITKLLQLHLRKKAPQPLDSYLRAYTAFVKPVATKGAKKWQLTAKGIDHLCAESGLALQRQASVEYDYDIGIICALNNPELQAVVEATGGDAQWKEIEEPNYTHIYKTTNIKCDDGKELRVIASTATSMGLTAAAIVTTQLILRFRPRMVVMIGIAAGTRDGGKTFGDVLVADPSVDYNSGKVVQNKGIREFLPDPYPIGLNPRLRSVLQQYRGKHKVFDDIRQKWHGKLPSENQLHVGPVGAADQVIDDSSRVLEIQKNWRKLIGIEMETYGVYRACHEAPEPKPRFVSFKSVCDFAAHKGDSWQQYAAFMAAEFTIHFFRREWHTLWPLRS